MIFLRNFGPDIAYVDERTAIDSLYNLKKNVAFTHTDRETIIRYGVLIYQLLDNLVNDRKAQNDILKKVIDSYRVKESDEISKVIIKIYNNRKLIIRKLLENWNIGTFGSQYLIRDITESVREKLKNIYYDIGKTKNMDPQEIDKLREKIDKIIEMSQRNWNVLMTEDLFDFYNILTECIESCEKSLKQHSKTSSNNELIRSLKVLRTLADNLLYLPLSSLFNKNNNSRYNKTVKIEDLVDYFILGNRIPNPAISTDIGGVLNIIKEFKYDNGKISIKEIDSENKNRKSILSHTLPFRRFER